MVTWLQEQILKCQQIQELESINLVDRERAVMLEKAYKRVLDFYRAYVKRHKEKKNDATRNPTLFD